MVRLGAMLDSMMTALDLEEGLAWLANAADTATPLPGLPGLR
jgi:hypothetical protein